MDLFGDDFVEVSDLGGINEEETHDPLSLFATCFNYIVNDPAPVLAEMERRGLTFQSLPTSLVQDILDSLAQPRKHQLWTPALLTNFFLALRNTTSPLTLSLSGIMREPVQMAFSNPDILVHVTSVTLTFPFYEEEDSSLLFEDKKFLQTLRLENWRRLTRLSIKGCPSLTNLLVVMVPSLLELVVDSESSSNLKSLNVPYCKSILFGDEGGLQEDVYNLSGIASLHSLTIEGYSISKFIPPRSYASITSLKITQTLFLSEEIEGKTGEVKRILFPEMNSDDPDRRLLKIEELHLKELGFIPSLIMRVSDYANLRSLSLDRVEGLKDILLEDLPHLRQLSISSVYFLVSLQVLRCTNLNSLHLFQLWKCKEMSFEGCVDVTDLYLNCISVGLEPFIAMGKKVQNLVLRRAPMINDYYLVDKAFPHILLKERIN